MAALKTVCDAIGACLLGLSSTPDEPYSHEQKAPAAFIEEGDHDEQRIANDIVHAMLYIEKPGKAFDKHLAHNVHTYGWRESLAKRVLSTLEQAIEKGAAMSVAMKDAYDKARAIAIAFATEHPVLAAAMVTLIAIGIIVMLAPYIVEALGFGELAPIEGSWAALWQSGFGNVPKGSFFSWLQRLGMVWGSK